ncbi:MAG: sulfurtransferase TusA family protein [Planctomycetota bacterium]|jgi:tRNA 2-thiouridine synthesizing protein A
MKTDATLDCLGLYCPMPIMRTKQELDGLEAGQVLEVLADDQGVKADMPAWCRRTGNELLGIEEDDGQIRLLVRKA